MAFLSDSEKQSLQQQIHAAESKTSGEIVTVIAQQSDGYRYIPLMWAALVSLSIPGLYFLYQYLTQSNWNYPGDSTFALARVYQVQVLVFLGLGMLLQLGNIRFLVVPKSVQRQRARRHARELFFVQNLHLTDKNNGILIFVSVAEHYVEIIVDESIAAVVDNSVWQETVDDFVANVKRGQIANGFSSAIEHCREVLWEHFPAPEGRPDELPNHLIEIDEY
jgi:putative membrane protein